MAIASTITALQMAASSEPFHIDEDRLVSPVLDQAFSAATSERHADVWSSYRRCGGNFCVCAPARGFRRLSLDECRQGDALGVIRERDGWGCHIDTPVSPDTGRSIVRARTK